MIDGMKPVEELLDEMVVVPHADKSVRVYYGRIGIGRKLQQKGPRCPETEHDFYLDRYPRIAKPDMPDKPRWYVDKVCRNCTRRKPIK